MGKPHHLNHCAEERQLKCIVTNACSILNKLDEIALMIKTQCPDIFAITESWLDPSIPDAEISFPDYSIFRCDRSAGRGGGCLLFVKSCLQPEQLLDVLPENPSGFEVCGCLINSTQGPLTLVNLYRPPSSDPETDDAVLQVIADVNSLNCGCLIMGDFNAPIVDWTNLFCSNEDSFSGKLLDASLEAFLTQGILIPRRVRKGNRPSNIDLIFTKLPTSITNVSSKSPLGKSDHLQVSFDSSLFL